MKKKINLFLDTNKFLALYTLPKEELEEIEKELLKAIKEESIVLWLPEQVINEFKRNRERILVERVQKLEKEVGEEMKLEKCKLSLTLADRGEIERIKKIESEIEVKFNELKEAKKKLRDKIAKDVKAKTFLADAFVKKLFDAAKVIKVETEIVRMAKLRFTLGNPPGKEGSFGDAVIWETLLSVMPEKEDLHFVGFDNDFRSKLDKSDFSPFLLEEWEERKNSKLLPFAHLGDFTKEAIPKIKSSNEIKTREEKLEREMEGVLSIHGLNANLEVATLALDTFNAAHKRLMAFTDLNTPAVKYLEHAEIYSPIFTSALNLQAQLTESIVPITTAGIQIADSYDWTKSPLYIAKGLTGNAGNDVLYDT